MSKSLETLLNEFYILSQEKSHERLTTEEIYVLKNSTKTKIIEEITNMEILKIKKMVQEENRRDRQKTSIKEWNNLFLVGLVLAFFTGLLVNQATDIISFMKGTTINLTLTLILILIFLLVILVIIMYAKTSAYSILDIASRDL